MLVTDCEEPRLDEGPEKGSRWTMVFDGASNALSNSTSSIIISLRAFILISLPGNYTNNMAEYEACIMGLKAAIDLIIKFLSVIGDSALVISQIKG